MKGFVKLFFNLAKTKFKLIYMKKLINLFLAIMVIATISCNKSDDDTHVENYTIQYSVTSSTPVEMDTIMYMDVNGTEQYLIGEGSFTHSFTQPSNNYHGKLYVSGNSGNNGSSDYSLEILDENSSIITVKESGTEGTYIGFTWLGEVSHTEN